MPIHPDEVYPALPQAGQMEDGQVDTKRLKKRAMEPLEMQELNIQIQEMNLQMREMKIEMREMKLERKEMTTEMREMYQELQELKLKMHAMTKKMQENENPRTSLGNQDTESKGELQLLFGNELHDAIFTMDKIRDREGEYVKIKLINTANRKTVKKGHLSSMEIEIVVLQGDFGFDGNEKWTNEEFNAKIIYGKPGSKQPLVKEKVKIKLTDGVGTIENLIFCDNSKWRGNKKFRLGARAIGMGTGVIIKEARSEAFAVKYQREKAKHLKKLKDEGKFVNRTSDLKQLYKTDPHKLRHEILNGCSNKQWDAYVQYIICDDANSNNLRIQEAEAICNTATTGPPLHQEYLQEPQAMATSPTHVRAQLEHSNDIQPADNSDSFPINDFCPSSSTHHMEPGLRDPGNENFPIDESVRMECVRAQLEHSNEIHQTPNNGDSFAINAFRDLGNENATVDLLSRFDAAESATPGPLDENLMLHAPNENVSVEDFETEPQAMATSPTHVRAQLEHNNDIHRPTNKGDSLPINDFRPSSSTLHMAPGLRDPGNENFPIDEPVRIPTNKGDSVPINDFCPSSSTHHMAPGFRDPRNENFSIDEQVRMESVRAQLEHSNDFHQTPNNSDSFPINVLRDLGNENATVDLLSTVDYEPFNGDSLPSIYDLSDLGNFSVDLWNFDKDDGFGYSPTHVRAQLEHSNDIHQTPNNGDSFAPSMSTNHMAQFAAPGPLDENQRTGQ